MLNAHCRFYAKVSVSTISGSPFRGSRSAEQSLSQVPREHTHPAEVSPCSCLRQKRLIQVQPPLAKVVSGTSEIQTPDAIPLLPDDSACFLSLCFEAL